MVLDAPGLVEKGERPAVREVCDFGTRHGGQARRARRPEGCAAAAAVVVMVRAGGRTKF